ncbi:Aste57867_3190 [Aphanomyces stellatus]|uniref:Aste57867_3190 protein n=1 Tax=Aphanomyces stellatus TaxID=120398 RepID=A0A485KEG2_9STRA|nr:hypothetical protein As57867_003181 [Aphanomyces stellatus]VFT80364.1 Aste57867_3190 [Aphanomyces stellatus]
MHTTTTTILALAMTIATAARQSVLTLSTPQRLVLQAELNQWKASFGAEASAMGLMPLQEGLNTDEVVSDELQRFLDTKFDVEAASLSNPDAQFHTDHPFALLTNDEFARLVQVSFNQSASALRGALGAAFDDTSPPRAPRASSADWSTHKCNPPIRNQGQCGSCWAFSTVGTVEAAHCLGAGELLDLSEQQIVSCSTNGGSMGCSGGWPAAAMDWMKDGACLESAWPYTSGKSGQTGSCSTQCQKSKLSVGPTVKVSGEAKLQSALDMQPVSVLVEAGNSVWRNYKSGVVSQCPGARSDHAVIAVAFDDASFKIKNSWGTSWGDKGYITLKRTGGAGKGMCNVAESVVYPTLTGHVTPTPSSSSAPPKPTATTWKPTPPPSRPTPLPTPTPSRGPTPQPSNDDPTDNDDDDCDFDDDDDDDDDDCDFGVEDDA